MERESLLKMSDSMNGSCAEVQRDTVEQYYEQIMDFLN